MRTVLSSALLISCLVGTGFASTDTPPALTGTGDDIRNVAAAHILRYGREMANYGNYREAVNAFKRVLAIDGCNETAREYLKNISRRSSSFRDLENYLESLPCNTPAETPDAPIPSDPQADETEDQPQTTKPETKKEDVSSGTKKTSWPEPDRKPPMMTAQPEDQSPTPETVQQARARLEQKERELEAKDRELATLKEKFEDTQKRLDIIQTSVESKNAQIKRLQSDLETLQP